MSGAGFLSVCSGIEAASVAWHALGWRAVGFAEMAAFPRAVLAHHYPTVPLHGDFTALIEQPAAIVDADVLVGGTPCQAFSVAGSRGSLADERGNLSLQYVRLANAIDSVRRNDGRAPCIALWENVPGVLSVDDNAFGCFLAALVGEDTALVSLGGGKWPDSGLVVGPERAAAWRVLDAQYFGLAQRRRRVFVVASSRAGFDPAEILFEPESRRRHHAPRRGPGERTSRNVVARPGSGGGLGTDHDLDGGLILASDGVPEISFCLNAGGMGRQDYETETLIPVVFDENQVTSKTNRSNPRPGDAHHTLPAKTTAPILVSALSQSSGAAGVRRLTPAECERLQGFPAGYTLIPWRGGTAPDGPRYKALGNSMAVPVMRWLGERVQRFSFEKAAAA